MSEPSDIEDLLRAALEARKRGEKKELNFQGAMLPGIDLRGADLAGANFQEADLCGADLAGAHLCRANFQGANLVGAILDGADLTGADCRGADLAGTRVDDAILTQTRLEGACLAAVLGDPLSFSEATMDRQTVDLSQFTMRDIAQLVVRGALVNENETVPPSLAPRLRSIPPSGSPFALELPAELQAPQGIAPISDPVPLAVHFDARPPSSLPLSIPPSSLRIGTSPSSSSTAASNAILLSLPPSSVRIGESSPSSSLGTVVMSIPPAPSRYPSIIPALRSAEVSARIQFVEQDDDRPHSLRVFQNLTALIESAQAEQAPPLSLRPALPKVQKLQESEFSFPETGEVYLGVTVTERLSSGTTSQCFRGTDQDGRDVVLRIFDPNCEGAALQLPAFQRGLRALNRLQTSAEEPMLSIVPLLAVAIDQTAYVVPFYPKKSAKELIDVRLTFEQGLEAIAGLSKTVARMHHEGVMVRSFKPENFLVDGFRLIVSEPDMVHLPTLSQYHGDIAGYAAYAAREEILGMGTRSPSADIFGLGKMLEFLLTGQEPLVPIGSPPLIAQREHVPQVLVSIVSRATADRAEERYQAVEDFVLDLEAFQREGDKAVLDASIPREAAPRLELPAFSTGPKLPDVEKMIEAQRARARPRPTKRETVPPPPSRSRQIEIGLALLGSLGALATLAMLVVAPRQVDMMMKVEPFLAMGFGLLVLLVPRRATKPWVFRVGAWAALSYAVFWTHPTSLARLTWHRHIHDGVEVKSSVAQLSRMGARDFSEANLSRADLTGIDLAGANFRGATLDDADFRGALLVEANFTGASLSGTRFVGANLWGARISGAKNWEQAICDRYTVLPSDWVCLKGGLTFRPQAVAESAPTSDLALP